MATTSWLPIPRALALRLLYAGGGLSVGTAAAGILLSPLSRVATTAFGILETLGLLASLAAVLALLSRRRTVMGPEERPADWDTLAAARRRLAAYANEAAAHSFAVPYVLITTGVLVLIVVTRVLTHSTTDNLQAIVFGLGFIAMTLGGLLPYLGLRREARRLARLANDAEDV